MQRLFLLICIMISLSNQVWADTYVDAKGGVKLEQATKLITMFGGVTITQPQNIIKALTVYAFYKNIQDFFKGQVLINDNLTRLEAVGKVELINKDSKVTGDRYIYDKKQGVMVLNAEKFPVIYTAPGKTLMAQKSFEYQEKKQLFLALGRPVLINHGMSNEFKTVGDLMSAKLNKKKEMKFVEIFANIKLFSKDILILADYGLYDLDKQKILLEGKVKIFNEKAFVSGCKIIIDMISGDSEMIPCSHQQNIITQYKVPKK